MKRFLLFLAIMAFAAGMVLALTQTGNLIVTVTSEEGQVLPGASVVIRSASLMGTRTQATGPTGKATFRNLPPGDYTIEVNMDGFQPMTQDGIGIRLGKTAKVDFALKIGQTKEIVTVVGQTPLVDTSSNTVSTDYDFNQFINHMPNNRHYNGIASLAAGVEAGNNPSVFGSGSQDNIYLVDGTNSTDSRSETWGSWVNVDAVADMSFMTAGVLPEYGHSVGSVMNIITKSGSNDISFLGRLELARTNWNDKTLNNPATTADDARLGAKQNNWTMNGGGPLYPDVLWWYLSYSKFDVITDYNRFLNPLTPNTGVAAQMVRDGHIFTAKGTLMVAENLKLQYYYKEDPMNIHNVNSGRTDYFGPKCLPSADQVQVEAGDTMMGNFSFVLSDSAFIEGRWARDRLELNVVDQQADPDGQWSASQTVGINYFSYDGWTWGTIPQYYTSERFSDNYAGSFSYLLQSDSLGEHDIKAGVEYLENSGLVEYTYYAGNEAIITGDLSGVGFDAVPYYYRYVIENRLPAASTSYKDLTAYVQDSWSVNDNLTVNFGLRTDIGSIYNNYDVEIISNGAFTTLSPRAGFAYDLDDIVLRGSYGIYYDVYSLYLADNFNTFATPEHWYSYVPTDGVDGRNGWDLDSDWTSGEPVWIHSIAADTSPSSMDEISAGVDYLFSDAMAISVTGVYRDYKNAIVPNDTDGDHAFNYANINTTEYGNSWKKFLGFIIDFRKRPVGDNLFLNFSLTYQDINGFRLNDNLAVYSANELQTDGNTANWWRDLRGINWIAKAQATYFFPNNWYLGLTANWTQGQAQTSTLNVATDGYSKVVTYPNGGADMDRLPSNMFFNVQFGVEQNIELPFDVPLWDDTALIGIYFNVFNLLDNQNEIRSTTAVTSGSYGQPDLWNNARNYQLGFRIEL